MPSTDALHVRLQRIGVARFIAARLRRAQRRDVVPAKVEPRKLQALKLRNQPIREAQLPRIVVLAKCVPAEPFVTRQPAPDVDHRRRRKRVGPVRAPVARNARRRILARRFRRVRPPLHPGKVRPRRLAVAAAHAVAVRNRPIQLAQPLVVAVPRTVHKQVVVQPVQALTHAVRRRIELHQFRRHRVHTPTRNYVPRKWRPDEASPVRIGTRRQRIINRNRPALIVDHLRIVATPFQRRRHRPQLDLRISFIQRFQRQHPEQLVLPVQQFRNHNRSVHGETKRVVLVLRLLHANRIPRIAVGVQVVILEKLIQLAVQLVRSRAQHDACHTAAKPPVRGVIRVGLNGNFLNRV